MRPRPSRLARGLRAAHLARVVFPCAFVCAWSIACGGARPVALGSSLGRMPACPSSPNCVSSVATDAVHSIAPLALQGSPDRAWAELESLLAGMPRVEIATRERGYLHAVFTTSLMRYRDDVEFWLSPGAHAIDVRSASRVGYGDMGQNRRRIETIRRALAERGVVAASE